MEERSSSSATQIVAQIQQDVANIKGIALYLQPVQDLSIDCGSQPGGISLRA